MTAEYLDLADYIGIASAVAGLDESMVAKVADLNLTDSALHAPSPGFGGTDFYSDFVDKAAVLVVRLARNHPLPEGNQRVAWVSLRYFLVLNGWEWVVRPSIDEAEQAVLAIASGEWDETRVAQWIRPKIEPSTGERPDTP